MPGPGFSMSNIVFLMFNDLMRDVIVLFLAIGGIVDHHCFNFVFHN